MLQVELDVERFECAEPLFEPARLGRDSLGVHKLVAKALETCEPSLRGTLLKNVLVAGGCARMQGFKDRLENELQALFPECVGENIRYVLVRVHVPRPAAHSNLSSTRAVESCGHTHYDSYSRPVAVMASLLSRVAY